MIGKPRMKSMTGLLISCIDGHLRSILLFIAVKMNKRTTFTGPKLNRSPQKHNKRITASITFILSVTIHHLQISKHPTPKKSTTDESQLYGYILFKHTVAV